MKSPQSDLRKPHSIGKEQYARTIGPKVARHYRDIIDFGTAYAMARLRQSRNSPQLSDLVPTKENSDEIAAEVFKKLLSGERQDWDGNPETLHKAIRSCINSVLSGRLKRSDNLPTAPIEDAELDWRYEDMGREDPYLEPAEEIANRRLQAKIIRHLFPDNDYEVEVAILSAMIIHRAFNADVIADLIGRTEEQVSNAFLRLSAYLQTNEFAERHSKVFEASLPSVLPQIARAAPRLSKRAAAVAVPLFASGLAIGLSTRQLTETSGLKTEKLYQPVRMGAPRAQARKKEMLEIISRVATWAGGKDQAATWYRAQPIPAFGGRTAESLVKSGQAPALRDYLDHIAMGGFA